jgi:tellurite resistance protein TerC
MWAGFVVFVIVMLAVDLGLFRREAKVVGPKQALTWCLVLAGLATGFGFLVNEWYGPERALEFATGYVIELALAVDNMFVFVVIFSAFAIPASRQHRVLLWGVIGALVLRAVFILAGGALLQAFHWTIYVFGAILAITGIRLLSQKDGAVKPEENPAIKLLERFMPVTTEFAGDSFTVVKAGRRYATPMLLALVAVEVTDVIFAVDSIPAIFAVTDDPFIVFTSNIFAILGLRSLYFLLADVVGRFAYLKIGLSLVLIFVGAKMLVIDFYKAPIVASLGVIVAILAGSMIASWAWPPREAQEASEVGTSARVASGG